MVGIKYCFIVVACHLNCRECEWSQSGTTTVCKQCDEGYVLRKDGSCAG